MRVNYLRLLELGREVLIAIGEDPDRPGLVETPRRWANFWREFIEYEPGKTETTFRSVAADQMVVISGMRVWSLCEHHLLPFYCDISVGYIPENEVLGLSKFARIANKYAHKLQIQERLVAEIADDVQLISGCQSVAVFAKGEHLCMTMRGVKTPALMKSSVTRGAFRESPQTRAEFLSMVEL